VTGEERQRTERRGEEREGRAAAASSEGAPPLIPARVCIERRCPNMVVGIAVGLHWNGSTNGNGCRSASDEGETNSEAHPTPYLLTSSSTTRLVVARCTSSWPKSAMMCKLGSRESREKSKTERQGANTESGFISCEQEHACGLLQERLCVSNELKQ
jgi:hypothetical protein